MANHSRASVIAPAGCGKTHLISQAVAYSSGRQLVLTHSHAGISAIKARMRDMQIPAGRYAIETLDSFAFKYARAFPILSEVAHESLEQFNWTAIRRGACKALTKVPVQQVIQSTYSGVFVDEYQDCDQPQHALILSLAALLPCRIVGDPLQAVFQTLHKSNAIVWEEVLAAFPQIGTLSIPHRWNKTNPKLGEWLLEVRQSIEKGKPISLSGQRFSGLTVVRTSEYFRKLKECSSLLNRKSGRVAILRRYPNECHALASKLNNRCVVFEDIQLGELERPAITIATLKGFERTKAVVQFAQRWLSNIPTPIKNACERLLSGKHPKTQYPGAGALIEKLITISRENSLLTVDEALAHFEAFKPTFKSFEVWRGLRKAIQEHDPSGDRTLLQTVQRQRDNLRHIGRTLPPRSIATPLLMKGLECEHALVFDLDTMECNANLYVSLTRATTTLTVISGNGYITPFT